MENFDVVDSVLFMPILCCFRAMIGAVKRHYKQNDFYTIYHQRHSNDFLQIFTLFVYFSVENAQFWNKYLHLALLFMRYWLILPFFTKKFHFNLWCCGNTPVYLNWPWFYVCQEVISPDNIDLKALNRVV